MAIATPVDTAPAIDSIKQAAPAPKAQVEHKIAKPVAARISTNGATEARPAPDGANSLSKTSDFTPATASVTPAPVVATAPSVAPVDAPAALRAPAADNDALIGAGAVGLISLIAIGGALIVRRRKRNDDSELSYEVNTVTAQVASPETSAVTAGARPSPRPAKVLANTTSTAISLDTMIAEQPSEANPFLTRKNRLRRAAFLMQQQDGANGGVVSSPVAAAPVDQEKFGNREPVRTSVTYDFGKTGIRRSGWKPATT